MTGYTDFYPIDNIATSSGFVPTVNAFEPQPSQDGPCGFVAELVPTGSSLIYSSYLSSQDLLVGSEEVPTSIAVDALGNAYVASYVLGSPGADTPNVFGAVAKVSYDPLVSPDARLIYQVRLGDSSLDGSNTNANGIAADDAGNAYVVGSTNAPLFAIARPANSSPGGEAVETGGYDAYVAKLDPSGGVTFADRLGGEKDDFGNGIAVDSAGNISIVGATASDAFPVNNALQSTQLPKDPKHAGEDGTAYTAFVSKLDATGANLLFSTYLGGTGNDVGTAIAVDSAGHAYVTGYTDSTNFPMRNAWQTTNLGVVSNLAGYAGGGDAFVAKLDTTGGALFYSSYLGGSHVYNPDIYSYLGDYTDYGTGIAVDRYGNAYVTGSVAATDFPATAGAAQQVPGGGTDAYGDPATDAFIAKIANDLTVTALPVNVIVGQPYTLPVATFTAPDSTAPVGNFSASINWGDGTIDTVTPQTSSDPTAPFTVAGNHTYLKAGSYPVVVTVTDTKDHLQATTAYDLSQEQGNQAETNIAVDPLNPKVLFAVANDFTLTHSLLFATHSTDGGVTWTPSTVSGFLTPASGNVPNSGGDPNVIFDRFGNLYVAELGADQKSIVVLQSSDGGKTFTLLKPSFSSTTGVDQPKLATGPADSAGPAGDASVWLTFEQGDATQSIFVAGARVTGLGAVQPFSSPADVSGDSMGLLSSVAVGPKGQVLVSWLNTTTNSPLDGDIMVNEDPNGLTNPQGFAPQGTDVANPHFIGTAISILPQDRRGVDANPRLAFDDSPGPHSGRVYLSYMGRPQANSPATDIYLMTSDDNGFSWSAPVQVNDNKGTDTPFLPSIAVDQKTGDVALSWYDTRNSASGKTTQFLTAVSGDGGKTFSTNVAVSIGTSDATDPTIQWESQDENGNPAPFQYGDYTGTAFYNGILYSAWSDNSKALANNPDTPQFDLAASRIAVAHATAPPPVVTGMPFTIAEGAAYSGQIATFTDADQGLSSTDFTATIDWGDGSSSPGTITSSGNPDTSYIVRPQSPHAYVLPGAYVLGITVTDTVNHLTSTLVSDVSQAPESESEGAIAVDPNDPTHLFAASNHSGVGLFGAYSTDGGATWNGRTLAGGTDGLPQASSDPKVVFDQYDNLFLTYLTNDSNSAVVVAMSTDFGLTFRVLETFSDPGGTDQPSVAVGPGAGGKGGSVWVTFVLLSDNAIVAAGASVSGNNLVGSFGELQVGPGPAGGPTRNFGDVAVGPQGQVVITYQTPTGGAGPSQIFANLDANGLQAGGFGPPILVTATNVGGFDPVPPQATRDVDAEANLAFDLTKGTHQGRLYLAYTDAPLSPTPRGRQPRHEHLRPLLRRQRHDLERPRPGQRRHGSCQPVSAQHRRGSDQRRRGRFLVRRPQ